MTVPARTTTVVNDRPSLSSRRLQGAEDVKENVTT
jgi:hypothetical protein